MINFQIPKFLKNKLFLTAFLFIPVVFPSHIDAFWFGKYKSMQQAREACNKWANEETKLGKAAEYEIWDEYTRSVRKYKYKNRYCRLEETTRQFLGLEKKRIKDGEMYTRRDINSFEEKIKKHFRY